MLLVRDSIKPFWEGTCSLGYVSDVCPQIRKYSSERLEERVGVPCCWQPLAGLWCLRVKVAIHSGSAWSAGECLVCWFMAPSQKEVCCRIECSVKYQLPLGDVTDWQVTQTLIPRPLRTKWCIS